MKIDLLELGLHDYLKTITQTVSGHRPFINTMLSVIYTEKFWILQFEHHPKVKVSNRFHFKEIQCDDPITSTLKRLKTISGYQYTQFVRRKTDGSWQVEAEIKDPDCFSFKGLRYSAIDIPKEILDIFIRSDYRYVYDCKQKAVNILSEGGQCDDYKDLSLSVLRGVTPLQKSYLESLGMRSSVTLPLVVNNTLRGLFSLHDSSPKYLCFKTRAVLTQIVNMYHDEMKWFHLSAFVDTVRTHRKALDHFFRFYKSSKNFTEACVIQIATLMGASTTALYNGQKWRTFGSGSFNDLDLEDMVSFVLQGRESSGSFYTSSLTNTYPQLEPFKEKASGLFIIWSKNLSKKSKYVLVFLKPEVIRDECFGSKKLNQSMDCNKHAFGYWAKALRGWSEDWSEVAKLIARLLLTRLKSLNNIRECESLSHYDSCP